MRYLMSVLFGLMFCQLFGQKEVLQHNLWVPTNFSTYTGQGFVPMPDSSLLSSEDWYIEGFSDQFVSGDSNVSGDNARGISTGWETTGGIYAFQDFIGRAMLIQPTASDFTPGFIEHFYINKTEEVIRHIRLESKTSVINNGGRSSLIRFQINYDSTWIDLDSAYSKKMIDDSIYILIDSVFDLPDIEIDTSGTFSIRWWADDAIGSGSRDELMIYNFSIASIRPTDSCIGPPNGHSAIELITREENSVTIKLIKPVKVNSILVVMSNDSLLDSALTQQAQYFTGSKIGDDVVVYRGGDTILTVDSLIPGSQYYFFIINSIDSFCLGGPLYQTDSIKKMEVRTKPSRPLYFETKCVTDSTVFIHWEAGTGLFDKFLLLGREGGLHPHTASSIDVDTQQFSSEFLYAPETGSTDPKSRILYIGDSTSLEITGIRKDSVYVFHLYAVSGHNLSAVISLSITAGLPEVTNAVLLSSNTSVLLSWYNPKQDCFDEIYVLASRDSIFINPASTAIASDSFGKGSVSADSAFVVYRGVEEDVSVKNLINNKLYFFRIFIRTGGQWSSGLLLTGEPAESTVLRKGDIAVVGVNTNYFGNGFDEVCILNLKPILPFTTLDFTDNGYERLHSGNWGDSEGFLRFKKKTDTIYLGSEICFRRQGAGVTDYNVYVEGALDTNWIVTHLNGIHAFDLNSQDQFYIMQGGIWRRSDVEHSASYSGRVLYGWTATGWFGDESHESDKFQHGSRVSSLYPGNECYYTDLASKAYPDKSRFNPVVDSLSKRELLLSIGDPAQWLSFQTDSAYSNGSIDFTLLEAANESEEHLWIGDHDSSWFTCKNWNVLTIPDKWSDVRMVKASQFPATISASPDTAYCRTIFIDSTSVIFHSGAILSVMKDVNLGELASFQTDDSADILPMLHLNGNFISNSDSIDLGDLKITFIGDSVSLLSVQGQMKINTLKSSSPGLQISGKLEISGSLILDSTLIIADKISILSTDSNSLLGYQPPNSTGDYGGVNYIMGKVERKLKPYVEYVFPLGDTMLGYNPLEIYLREDFGSIMAELIPSEAGFLDLDTTAVCEGDSISIKNNVLTGQAYWYIRGDSATYDISLHPNANNLNLYPNPDSAYRVLKADSIYAGNIWQKFEHGDLCDYGTYYNAVGQNMSGFSILSIGGTFGGVLPVRFTSFDLYRDHGHSVYLKWTVAFEYDCDHYVIERSKDANNFDVVGKIPCRNSMYETNYEHVDSFPFFPGTYYRIGQIDFDGSRSSSGIKYIEIEGKDQLVWPNPTPGSIYISEKVDYIVVYDLNGNQLLGAKQTENLDISSLPSACYFLKLFLLGGFTEYFLLHKYN